MERKGEETPREEFQGILVNEHCVTFYAFNKNKIQVCGVYKVSSKAV